MVGIVGDCIFHDFWTQSVEIPHRHRSVIEAEYTVCVIQTIEMQDKLK